jgi:hypothetical protein
MEAEETAASEEQPQQSIFEHVADSILDGALPEQQAPEVAEEAETQEAEPEQQEEAPKPKFKVKVDGDEMEVDQDELIKGYQINKHLTQKGQKLAEEEKRLAAYQGLIKHFDDPKFAQHAFSYFDQQKQKAEEPEQPPDDPIERIKWDAKREVLQSLQPELEKRDKAVQGLERQQQVGQVLGQLQARDGQDFQVVYSNLKGYVEKNYPPAAAKVLLEQADADQSVFVDIYDAAMKDFKAFKATKETPTKPAKERAPVLESPGSDTGDTEIMAKTKQVKKLKAEALRDGDPDALQKWFLASGLVDSLV